MKELLKIKDVNEMTIDELIGQVIMVGLPYDYLDQGSIKFINDYKIGNFILFSRNYKNTNQMKSFMKDLYQNSLKVTDSFPLVSIDQEGGMVTRLFKDVVFPASPLTTSSTSIKNAPYISGNIIGKDMLKLGMNLNLAPCLEINKELSYPLINVRGYGATREIVLENASMFVKGLQDAGALSCLKHFPGDGSSLKDSHLELPFVLDKKEDVIEYNMYPFLNLLNSDAIMSSHSLFKEFDSVPTTLSHKMLTEFLREEKGYQGLLISDGMEMKAILDNYGIAKGCVMALNAGCDILLLCHEYSEQKLALKSVKEACLNGELSIDLIKEKVARINKAKQKLINGLNNYCDFDAPYKRVEEEHKIMEEIVENSYTLVSGKKPTLSNNTLILSPKAMVSSIVEDEFNRRDLTQSLKNNFPNTEIIEFNNDLSCKIDELVNKYDKIIIYSYDVYSDINQRKIINKILSLKEEVYVISLKGPSDMQYFENLVNYSCLYEYTPNSIRTVVRQLKQQMNLNGKLPN